MKKLFVIFFLMTLCNISSAQSGWGYVNYTSYKLFNGNGSTNQYWRFPNTAAEFDNMLNTANSNTTITNTGEVTLATMCDGSTGAPHWNGDYYAIKFDFYFVPQETGTYTFGVNSDDASDISIGGTIVATYYGGHGASGYQWGTINLVAGTKYKVVARYQEYGGGDALYVRWSRPSAPNTFSYWSNEVTNIASEPTKKANINFDFGGTLDKTKFNIGSSLSSSGLIDVTNLLDSNKVSNGNKGTIVSGQTEWSYVNTTNGTNTLYIDLRKFGNTNVSTITQIKILDVYEGPVTYIGSDIYWAYYRIPTTIPKLTDGTSTYVSNIRNAGYSNYAFTCDVSFASYMQYKPQSVTMTTTNNLTTLYSSIVTVSDVYLAFKELSNMGGLFGNNSNGGQFTYGIQYKNADVNNDGIFDEKDCFSLLQYLTGTKPLVDTMNLKKTLRLIPTSTYNTIGVSNWSTTPSYLGDTYNFDINTGKPTDTFNISATWKGDINLSHSATPASNGITTMGLRTMSLTTNNDVEADIMMENIGENIVTTINVIPNGNQIAATQFDVYFDNLILDFVKVEYTNQTSTNFGKNNGSFISVGSLNTSGGLISNIGYKIIFKPKSTFTNILGLISVNSVETIGTNLNKINVKVL